MKHTTKLYRVHHNRKGTFEMEVPLEEQCDEDSIWISGVVTKLISSSRISLDEHITIRRSYCKIELIKTGESK